MLKNKPKLTYCGITVVLSNPSRFDKVSLLTANGGTMFNNFCLQPEFNLMQCEVRLADDTSPWLPGTRVIVLLGEYAMHKHCPKVTGNNTLNEMRGSPLYVAGIPAIASYFPQDAVDHKGHEQALNTDSKEYKEDGGEGDDDDEGDVKRFSPTKRKNYAFWLRMDMKKVKFLVKNSHELWPIEPEPTYHIYPSADKVINLLEKTKNEVMDFDMETDYEDANLLCFSFSFNGTDIYCVPILDYNYLWAYTSAHNILMALYVAVRDNTCVAHNGHSFDFFVLLYKYRIAVRKPYDTMLSMHRCFPDIEKSLGHCTSLWTYQVFHKDSDSRAYFTSEQMMQKLRYCGKDVFTMGLIRKAITKYATTIPGLGDSIACAQRSIRPYLTATFQGLSYSEVKRKATMEDNDRLMMQYLRCIRLLVGEEGIAEINKTSSKGAKGFPFSNKPCVEYFHNILGYAVVARGDVNKDGERSPSLGKVAMFKLALKHDNPVIRFILMYRTLKKESGSLKFIPWRGEDGKIINRDKYGQDQLMLLQ